MKVSIRTTFLVIFLLASFTVSSVVVVSEYFFTKKSILASTQTLFMAAVSEFSSPEKLELFLQKSVDASLHVKSITHNQLSEYKVCQTQQRGNLILEDRSHYGLCSSLKDGEFVLLQGDSFSLMKPYKKNLLFSFVVALVVILISVPIVFIATGFLVKPIKIFILNNKKIVRRECEDIEKMQTNILEFDALSTSIAQVAKSIESKE